MLTIKNSASKVYLNDIQAFENKYKVELPADYKEFLLNNNGGTPSKVYYTDNNADIVVNFFLSLGSKDYSLEEYIQDWREEIQLLELIPIGEDAFGNLICMACKGDKKGHIYFFQHEFPELKIIAPSFNDLLLNLKKDLDQ